MYVKTRADWERQRPQLLAALYEFADALKRRPFANVQGLRGVSAFALYWFVRQVRPTIVFEVGVWKGFSTWIIEQAAPEAEVHCFDPLFFLQPFLDAAQIGATYRSPRAHYSAQDFSCADVAQAVERHERPLAFFDDHQNKLPRLLQARDAGIREIVFDDNTTYHDTHRTLEHERENPRSLALLERLLERYEIFPALWDIDWVLGGIHIKEDGLGGFAVDERLRDIYADREWHSCVTRVTLVSTA
jgi:hypothetical protein